MSHRSLIRNTVKTLLKGATSVGDSVYTNLFRHISEEELPVIIIYSKSEPVERFDEAPKSYLRTLILNIEVIVKGGENLDAEAALDKITEEIEQLIEKDDSLGTYCDKNKKTCYVANRTELQNTEYTFKPEGQSPVGLATMTYAVQYHQQIVIDCFPDLENVNVKYQVGHDGAVDDDVIDAEDSIDVPTV